MEEVGGRSTMRGTIGDMLELGSGQVRKKNLPLLRWFAPHMLWKVTDGHVDQIGTLVSKRGELRLVGGDYDGDNCNIPLPSLAFDLFLQTTTCHKQIKGLNSVTYLR